MQAKQDGRGVSESKEDSRRAGRGLLWVTGAKVFFVVSSTVIWAVLPRIFDDEAVFGLFAVAFGFASIINAVLISSTLQTVSKLVSEHDERGPAVLRQGLRIQLVVGSVVGSLLFFGAPLLVRWWFEDEAFEPILRLAGGVAVTYALYATLVGYLNGRRRFDHQAQLDMTFGVLRTVGILGGAALGLGAFGAFGGFSVAAGIILVVALVSVGWGASGEGLPLRRWLTFLAPIMAYQAALNGLLQIDLQVLHGTVARMAAEQGLEAPEELAARLSGFYRAAQMFAFVPYQLILSVTLVVFPMVSRATSFGDGEAARSYVRNALRFSLLVLLSIATPIAGSARGVLGVVYTDSYLLGSSALQILVFGQVAFALFVIAATIVAGGGRPMRSAAVALFAVIVVVVAVYVGVRIAGLQGDRPLVATAIGTSIGASVALLAMGTIVYRTFGAFVPPLSAVRGAVAGAVAFGCAHVIPHDSVLGAIAALAGGFFAFGGVLVVLGELGRDDLQALRRILGRQRA